MHSQLSLWAFEIIMSDISMFSSLVFNESDSCVRAKGFGTFSANQRS